MSTNKVSDVFDSFLGKISDYTFLNVSDEDLEKDLHKYLRTSCAKFHQCKKSLILNNDRTEFKDHLSYFEVEILSKLMVVEYMHPQILSSETIRQSLSDGDFKIYSQSAHLRELNLLYRQMKKESQQMILDYTYFKMYKEDDKNDK